MNISTCQWKEISVKIILFGELIWLLLLLLLLLFSYYIMWGGNLNLTFLNSQ